MIKTRVTPTRGFLNRKPQKNYCITQLTLYTVLDFPSNFMLGLSRYAQSALHTSWSRRFLSCLRGLISVFKPGYSLMIFISSSCLPLASASFSQAGRLPRPVQVCCGLSGFINFGGNFDLPALLLVSRPNNSSTVVFNSLAKVSASLLNSATRCWWRWRSTFSASAVSYTHLTLPTIYSV